MKDEAKTKRQLIQELLELRQQIVKLEKAKAGRQQIEESLRESEKKYKQVVEGATEFIHTTDIRGNITFANPAALQGVGYSLEEIKRFNYLDLILPEHHQRLSEIYINQFRERKPTLYVEVPFFSKSGEIIWWGQNSSLIFEDGKVVGFHSVSRDITELKRAEETLRRSEEEAKRLAKENAVMAEIGRIISSTLNIEEVYELFAKEADKLIPLDRIAINLLNPQENKITSLYISGVEVGRRKAGDSYPYAGSISEEIIRTRKSLFIQTEDQDELVRYSPDLLTTFQAGLRSMISVPLIAQDKVIGIMHIRAVKPNAYTDRDVQLAERIGAQIAGAIANAQLFADRKRMEEALRESEEKFRTMTATATDAITLIDNRGCIIFWNPAAEKMFGYSPQGANGKELHSLLAPQRYYEAYQKGFKKFKTTGEGLAINNTIEFMALKKNGTEFPIEVSTSALNLKGQWHAVGIIRDITERKRAEKEKEKLIGDLQKTLAEVKTLKGIFPICASCKKIRDDKGYWNQVESYIRDHTEAEFSHGICPECMKNLYPEFYKKDK